MATASLLKAFTYTPSGKITVNKNDYLIFIISATEGVSISPDSVGFPTPTLLASTSTQNATYQLYIYGGLHTGTSGDVSYNITMNFGNSATIIYKVTPSVGESLSVINPINVQSVSPGTSISITTTVDPNPGDVIFGATTSAGYQGKVIDTDSINGTWSIDASSSASTSYGYVTTSGQYKNITAKGSQTYNGTFTSSNVCSALITVSAEQRGSYWGLRA